MKTVPSVKAKIPTNELIDYITDLVKTILDELLDYRSWGRLNKLDLDKAGMNSGLKSLFYFPTKGKSILDNFLTNNNALFSKCNPSKHG